MIIEKLNSDIQFELTSTSDILVFSILRPSEKKNKKKTNQMKMRRTRSWLIAIEK